jgi:hypothetical protein
MDMAKISTNIGDCKFPSTISPYNRNPLSINKRQPKIKYPILNLIIIPPNKYI